MFYEKICSLQKQSEGWNIHRISSSMFVAKSVISFGITLFPLPGRRWNWRMLLVVPSRLVKAPLRGGHNPNLHLWFQIRIQNLLEHRVWLKLAQELHQVPLIASWRQEQINTRRLPLNQKTLNLRLQGRRGSLVKFISQCAVPWKLMLFVFFMLLVQYCDICYFSLPWVSYVEGPML